MRQIPMTAMGSRELTQIAEGGRLRRIRHSRRFSEMACHRSELALGAGLGLWAGRLPIEVFDA